MAKCSQYSVNQPWKSLFTSIAHQTWTRIKFLEGSGSKLCWIYVAIRKFPRISDAKIKEGVFFNTGSEVQKEAWKSLKNVTTNFLGGNHKAEKYCEMVADLVQSYNAVGEICL